MRLFDGWVLLLLMIFIQNNDGGRAFGHSEVDEGRHRMKPLKPTRKISLGGNLKNKEANQDGVPAVSGLTSLSQVATRNLLMKTGSSREVPFHESTKKARRSRKKRTLKGVNKGHQRDDEAFMEDYRVPRSHPPRNN